MTIKQFIEKSVEGGWIPQRPYLVLQFEKGAKLYADTVLAQMLIQEIVLDPLAWQAVGKVEGWAKCVCSCGNKEFKLFQRVESHCMECTKCDEVINRKNPEWKFQMHRMIDALADGKTIESFIKTL